MDRRNGKSTCIICMGLLAATLAFLFAIPVPAQEAVQHLPRFRHIDNDGGVALLPVAGEVTLLTDDDFAPWSFLGEDGQPRGIAVDLALAACRAARMTCKVKALVFAKLRPALMAKQGDAIISGLRPDDSLFAETRFTRPYFISLGRFAVRQGASLPSNDARALAGKRVGHVKDSAHGQFLQRYYADAQLSAHDSLDAALEALRTGALDAVFGDSVAMTFWLAGSKSRGCGQPLGKAFIDRETFSRELVFVTRPDRENLRDIFDTSLDGLETKGDTARIFSAYLPGLVW
jgi:polar amino acid transport system substrate-binding protein